MILCIVKHNDCIGPPILIDSIEMLTKLVDEEHEGLAICLSLVDGEVQMTITADSSNNIHIAKSLQVHSLVVSSFHHPTPLSLISHSNDTFIDIDDPHLVTHEFNILVGSILSLQFGLWTIVKDSDWADQSIRDIQLRP
jgi:hypothetical protein